jgi:hypothetical protein
MIARWLLAGIVITFMGCVLSALLIVKALRAARAEDVVNLVEWKSDREVVNRLVAAVALLLLAGAMAL